MNTKFQFDSESFTSNGRCNTIEVELYVGKHDKGWSIEALWDITQCVRRKWHEFNEQDQKDITRLADSYAAIAEEGDADET